MTKDKKYLLNNVFAFHSAYAILIVIPCMIIFAFIYYYFFGPNFRLGFVMIFTIICIGTFAFVLKKMSKRVTVWFNDDYLFVQKGDLKQEKYLKSDVLGFYSYDYETKSSILKKSLIKFKFCLKNGQKIYFNDSEYRTKYNQVKGKELEEFLKILKLELGFKKISKNKLLNVYWYSHN